MEIYKYTTIIKELTQKLKHEQSKQGDIDAKIIQLREEKERLDRSYESNMEKLKQGGLGNNCPKGFNMNDYIKKKNTTPIIVIK